MRSSQKFPTPRGMMEGRIDTHAWGPGISLVTFSGIVDTLNYACTTPIEADRCVVRFNFLFKTMGDEETTRNVGRAFVAEVDKQVTRGPADLGAQGPPRASGPGRQRRPVHEVPPVGGAVLRRAASATSALVYPPPFWPDRLDDAPAKATASARTPGSRGERAGPVGVVRLGILLSPSGGGHRRRDRRRGIDRLAGEQAHGVAARRHRRDRCARAVPSDGRAPAGVGAA